MKKYFIIILSFLLVFAACDKDEEKDDEKTLFPKAEKTVFVYMPYTGYGANLYPYFIQNIEDIKKAIVKAGGLENKYLMVLIANDENRSELIKIQYKGGKCIEDTIKRYQNVANMMFNQEHWITYILNQVKSYAPANTYSMIIGSHGMGWLEGNKASRAAYIKARRRDRNKDLHPITRWFGGDACQTETKTLASGIANSGIKKMQYIMFDDCYMANIEAAYDIKDVTNYLIACPTEIMGFGMPYEKIWEELVAESPNYENICNNFYQFYSHYEINNHPFHHGTIGVIRCKELSNMANMMKTIFEHVKNTNDLSQKVQIMDGYQPAIFFDFGDYVEKYCTDATLLAQFRDELKKLVPYKAHTPTYYTSLDNSRPIREIKTYSGITISAPSIHALVKRNWKKTAFYLSTH